MNEVLYGVLPGLGSGLSTSSHGEVRAAWLWRRHSPRLVAA